MDGLMPKQFDDTLGALLLGGLFAMAYVNFVFGACFDCGVDGGLAL